MDLLLARLAGSPPPSLAGLTARLRETDWLVPVPAAPGPRDSYFAFSGGVVRLVLRPSSRRSRFESPALSVQTQRESRLESLAPRVFALARTLNLGIETPLQIPAAGWLEPPVPLDPDQLQRPLRVARTFSEEQAWPLLRFVLAGPECLELAESHPILAALVATATVYDGQPRADLPVRDRTAVLRDLARRPRREILRALGLPATESMVRLLARVAPPAQDFHALWILACEPLAPSAAKALRHLPRLTSGAVRLAASPSLWPHVGAGLLGEAAERPDNGFISMYLSDTLRMADRLGRRADVGVIRSREHLLATHDAFLELYNTRPVPALQGFGCVRFADLDDDPRGADLPSAPPPRGTQTIEPLTTPEALLEEGRQMQHCVGSYDGRVLRRTCAVYRVLAPERATLSLAWRPARGAWEIEQLRGPQNRPVDPAVEDAVRQWLRTGANP